MDWQEITAILLLIWSIAYVVRRIYRTLTRGEGSKNCANCALMEIERHKRK